MTQARYLGVGLYSIRDAARIIGVKPYKLRRWVKEYSYAIRGVSYYHPPLVHRYFEGQDQPITFLELVELLFVKLFRAQGVSIQTIRRAAKAAARMFETPYPFAVKRFDTDGRSIFATLRFEDEIATHKVIEELGRGQTVFETVAPLFFRKIDYGYAEALRFWPMEREGRVVLDPERSFGRPIDAETGVPTGALFDAVRAAGGQDSTMVAEWFGVPLAAVEAAIRYERSLLEAA